LSKTEYFEKMLKDASEDEVSAYFDAIDKRITHYPLQYIIGEWEFMGLPFKVNENVLIPRQDTEVLVEKAFKVVENELNINDKNVSVMDMCTGSGCIGISVAFKYKNINVVCADISKEALEVAKENARMNNVENISFVESDLFRNITGKYDIIIANPPYIASAECEKLMPEVKNYEPRIALDGDIDGLKFYRNIIEQSKEFLNENGYILFEIGYNQREDVVELLRENGYIDIEALKDLSGNDRVVIGKRRITYV
jgi:release factor glutamine methyltransferase